MCRSLFLSFVKNNKSFILISLLGTSLALTCVFLHLGHEYRNFLDDWHTYSFERTLTLSSQNAKEILKSVESALPTYNLIVLGQGDVAGVSYNKSTPYTVNFGRFFQKNDEKVVVVSENFVGKHNKATIENFWNQPLILKGTKFTPIGQIDEPNDSEPYISPLTAPIHILLKDFLNLNFPANYLHFEFQSPLTETEFQTLQSILIPFQSSIERLKLPQPMQTFWSYVRPKLPVYSILFLTLLLSVISVWSVCFNKELSKFSIYTLVGATHRHIFKLLFVEIFSLIFLASSASIALFYGLVKFSFEEFYAPLPLNFCVSISSVVFVLVLLMQYFSFLTQKRGKQ